MQALLSGQAGLAVLLNGANASLLWVDDDAPVDGFTDAVAGLVLRDLPDFVLLQDVSQSEVKSRLHTRWALDRSVRLLQIALDDEEEDEIALEALAVVEEFLSCDIERDLASALCVAPPSTDCGSHSCHGPGFGSRKDEDIPSHTNRTARPHSCGSGGAGRTALDFIRRH